MAEIFAKDVGSYEMSPNKVNFNVDLSVILWVELPPPQISRLKSSPHSSWECDYI